MITSAALVSYKNRSLLKVRPLTLQIKILNGSIMAFAFSYVVFVDSDAFYKHIYG